MRRIALYLFVLSLTSNAWAFGPKGHRVVADIANKHMTPEALQAVNEILGGELIAAAATWPDDMRNSPNKTYWKKASNWHFINVPPGQTYEESTKETNGDAYQKLTECIALTPNVKADMRARAECLKWVLHLVGDLHQPLHLGYPADRGGNKISVTWFGKTTNLHDVWDVELIEQEGLSFTEYAHFIDSPTEADVRQWQSDKIEDWIKEGLILRQTVYAIPSSEMSYQYVYDYTSLEKQQLLKAGVRLAGVLNRMFADR